MNNFNLSDSERHVLREIWNGFNSRCYNPNNSGYGRYGARGISVYPNWRRSNDNPEAFNNFIQWILSPEGIGLRPEEKHPSGHSLYSIDRIDNNGNYEPGNLKWSTTQEQINNSTASNKTEYKGVSYSSLTVLCDELGLNYDIVRKRISRDNMTLEEAIETPIMDNSLSYKGVTYPSLTVLCDELGLNYGTINGRINRDKMTIEQAIETPLRDLSVTYKNITYPSLLDLCNKLELNYGTVNGRMLKDNMTLEEAIETPLRYNPVTYKNKVYSNLPSLCDELGLDQTLIRNRMCKQNMTLEQAIEAPLRDDSLVYNNVTYFSLSELCDKLGLNYKTIYSRISRGMNLQQAIKTNLRDDSITYKGKVYQSLTELCNVLGLNYNTTKNRINLAGMTLEEAISKPVEVHIFSIDDMVFGNLQILTRMYGFRTIYDKNIMPKEELINYILNYRKENSDEFIAKGIKFKTKRLAKQMSLHSNLLFVYKLVDGKYILLDSITLPKDLLNVIDEIKNGVIETTSTITTELIKSPNFLYEVAEAMTVSIGTDKFYLVNHIDIKNK